MINIILCISILLNICFIGAFIYFRFFKKDENDEDYNVYIPGIKNLFMEMQNKYINHNVGYRYMGYIKTVFPNGKEKIIWKSNTYKWSETAKREMNIRFKFLCKFYGLNENGEASDFRYSFNKNLNDTTK